MRKTVGFNVLATITVIFTALVLVAGFQVAFKPAGHVAPAVRMVFDRALELR